MTLPRIPRSAAWAIVASLATLFLARGCERPAEVRTELVVDTASAALWRARHDRLAREHADSVGLLEKARRAAAGIERRTPARVVVYDTVVDLRRDTVILYAQQDARGRLTIGAGVPDSAGHRPVEARGISIGDCDDGWSIRGTSVVCNRARLGHLSVIVRGGVEVQALDYPALRPEPALATGLRWQPSYRSTWAVEATAEPSGRVKLQVERGFRLF